MSAKCWQPNGWGWCAEKYCEKSSPPGSSPEGDPRTNAKYKLSAAGKKMCRGLELGRSEANLSMQRWFRGDISTIVISIKN